MSIEELKKDREEFAKLIADAKRVRVKNALTVAKAELDKEIVNLEMKARQEKGGQTAPRRYLVELSEYAWDQSDKFVKLFITLDGVQSCDESNVTVNFTPNTMALLVSNMNGKDYGLTINNLAHGIDVAKSYHKVKTDLVAIYLKKEEEGRHWDFLTTIGKYMKQKQDSELKSEAENPEDSLVNIMKKMYNSGDSKTKAMIAKVWTESQQKAMTGNTMEM